MAFVNPRYLVETDWLAAHLDDPDLRILDCTVFLRPPAGESAPRASWTTESGRAAWEAGHIPGAGFADLIHDLSDRQSALPFMMPPAAQFAAAMARHGVGEGTHVVLYDAAANMWAARVWWMLRAFGFDHTAVLNGGWRRWTTEGRPVSTDPPAPARVGQPGGPPRLAPRPRPELIADKAEVLAAIGRGETCIVNALGGRLHRGEGDSPYGRPGRIAGSVNVPAGLMVDAETHAYLPAEQVRAAFAGAGVLDRERVITYCGGGIAASSDALLLTLLGVPNVAVYDGSLSEWAAEASLPMEVG